MFQRYIVLLLICFNCFIEVECQDYQFYNMKSITKTLLEKYSNDRQCAIAYVKPVNVNFKELIFGGFGTRFVVKDTNQMYIASKPNPTNRKHSEDAILESLPTMIDTIIKSHPGQKVDVYLFTLNSPCCKPGRENVKVSGLSNYYRCRPYSCSSLISSYALKHLSSQKQHIQNMYVSWKFPYVSKHHNAKPPPKSIMYYKNYFFGIQQLLAARKLTLLLEEPRENSVQYRWFQKVMAECLIKKNFLMKINVIIDLIINVHTIW